MSMKMAGGSAMKFASLHIVALFALLLPLTLSCSRSVSSLNKSTEAEVKSPLPPPKAFVADYANVIDEESEARLQSILTELRDKSEIEFAVVTVETTGGQSIFDYSLAVAKGWGVGPKDTSRGGGLLLMLADKDRQWRIQVSRSLEKDLPDEVSKTFGEQLTLFCKQGKYSEGITKFVEAVIKRLQETRGSRDIPS